MFLLMQDLWGAEVVGELCFFFNNTRSLCLPLGEDFWNAVAFSVSVMLGIIKIDGFENIFHYLLDTAWLLFRLFSHHQNKTCCFQRLWN